jgi:hypothetical protein
VAPVHAAEPALTQAASAVFSAAFAVARSRSVRCWAATTAAWSWATVPPDDPPPGVPPPGVPLGEALGVGRPDGDGVAAVSTKAVSVAVADPVPEVDADADVTLLDSPLSSSARVASAVLNADFADASVAARVVRSRVASR